MDRKAFEGVMMLAAVAAGGAVIGNPFVSAALAVAIGLGIVEFSAWFQRRQQNKG